MKTIIEKYKYKKGQKLHLDQIYIIQGLGSNDWWESLISGSNTKSPSDDIIITKDIEIEIKITK
jgi:hypothetical protein